MRMNLLFPATAFSAGGGGALSAWLAGDSNLHSVGPARAPRDERESCRDPAVTFREMGLHRGVIRASSQTGGRGTVDGGACGLWL